ncbi:MAG: hypothetical protein LBE02_06990 [Spirochaetaceae bacterium]|nr:hypothetical protein [Spirochaetaceae bacterium]
MAYYYLVAQLPSLIYGQGAPMSAARFRELALQALSPEDAAFLGFFTLNPFAAPPAGIPGGCDFLDKWREYEAALRLNLAKYRGAKIKREAPADIPDYPADAAAAAKAAAALDSPLEAELFLDESRWRAIDLFQGLDYFDRNTVYAYLLKLLLLERRACFKAEEGFAEYKGLYAAVMGAAGSGVFPQAGTSSSNESGEPK